jgi:hypothetical protein
MTAFLPLPGGFIKLAERFIDPAFAFATGWNYCYQWTLTLPAELSAAAAIIGYWDSTTSPAVWISVCLVVAIGINALGVGEQFLYDTFLPFTICRRCIRRGRVLVLVNPSVMLPFVTPLTDLSLVQ